MNQKPDDIVWAELEGRAEFEASNAKVAEMVAEQNAVKAKHKKAALKKLAKIANLTEDEVAAL